MSKPHILYRVAHPKAARPWTFRTQRRYTSVVAGRLGVDLRILTKHARPDLAWREAAKWIRGVGGRIRAKDVLVLDATPIAGGR